MTNITRRTALRGAGAAIAAVGLSSAHILQTPASEFAECPAALANLTAAYHDAHVASRSAEQAFNQVREEVRKRVDAAGIYVPYTGFGNYYAQLGSGHRCTYAGAARQQLAKDRDRDLAGCTTPSARRMVRSRYYRLRDKVEAGIAKVTAIREAGGLEAAICVDTEARHRAYRAKDALLAYQPTTLIEVAAIVRCLYVTARDTEGFHSYPAAQVAIMLNPDLGEVA